MYLWGTKRIRLYFLAISFSIGLLSCIGWIIGFELLTNAYYGGVSMKVPTSLCMVLISISVSCVTDKFNGNIKKKEMIGNITSGIVLTYMAFLVLASNLGQVMIHPVDNSVKTVSPGQPSLITIFLFLTLTAQYLLWEQNIINDQTKKIIPMIVIFCSSIAVIGHLFDINYFQYYIPEKSTAMALNTSVGFLIVGISWLNICSEYRSFNS